MLPSSSKVKRAYCAFAADNFCELSINSDQIGMISGFRHAQIFDITKKRGKDKNVFSAVVHSK